MSVFNKDRYLLVTCTGWWPAYPQRDSIPQLHPAPPAVQQHQQQQQQAADTSVMSDKTAADVTAAGPQPSPPPHQPASDVTDQQ